MIRDDVNVLVEQIDASMAHAVVGLGLDRVRALGRDAVDTGRFLQDFWIDRNDPHQARLAHDLADLGTKLGVMAAKRNASRMNTYLGARLKNAAANGIAIKSKINGSPTLRTGAL